MNKLASSPPSPLDPLMLQFLSYIQDHPDGFAPGVQTAAMVTATDIPDALVDALFVSAKTRSLIGPDFNARGRTRWIVSNKGRQFVNLRTSTAAAAAAAETSEGDSA
ncbi:MAG: hypothetical protein WKF81_01835 [Thermomicrobiales bacterium]